MAKSLDSVFSGQLTPAGLLVSTSFVPASTDLAAEVPSNNRVCFYYFLSVIPYSNFSFSSVFVFRCLVSPLTQLLVEWAPFWITVSGHWLWRISLLWFDPSPRSLISSSLFILLTLIFFLSSITPLALLPAVLDASPVMIQTPVLLLLNSEVNARLVLAAVNLAASNVRLTRLSIVSI